MFKTFIFMLVALLLSSNAYAQWELVNNESSVNYISIKKSKVAEVNSFKQLKGSIDRNGKLSVDIDLGSVETNIPVRNERMKSMLFDIASFPAATVSATLNSGALTKMQVGETYQRSVDFNLSLHGVAKDMVAKVRVVKLAKNRILAMTAIPIIVNADHYGLVAGVEKLREVAKLPSISTAVPVTFSLVFEQQ